MRCTRSSESTSFPWLVSFVDLLRRERVGSMRHTSVKNDGQNKGEHQPYFGTEIDVTVIPYWFHSTLLLLLSVHSWQVKYLGFWNPHLWSLLIQGTWIFVTQLTVSSHCLSVCWLWHLCWCCLCCAWTTLGTQPVLWPALQETTHSAFDATKNAAYREKNLSPGQL